MKISIEEIIKTGELYPLFWGMSEKNLIDVLKNLARIIEDLKLRQHPFLLIDHIELYFAKDEYNDLDELIIQTHRIKPGAESRYFDFGWINKNLTYKSTKQMLIKLGWNFEEGRTKYSQSPLLIVDNKSIFTFYDESQYDNATLDECELCKIVIKSPDK
ncbi:hypothetical protein [Hymenobacter weizhouensis]|uniref:hypothetical protein n=1 Tax=Hymenobacter sp. YIM 151500-1 TaxID=2987689 RepID=UPI00222669B3|nr:hypothetical protein [Hymenobacter sp. YIM 151500-1]UYZ63902.1 hypothetical protein OIS53_03435 [Hymenobacter sp. YIM 151500-1]